MTRKEGLCNKNYFICQHGKFWETNVLAGNFIRLGPVRTVQFIPVDYKDLLWVRESMVGSALISEYMS